MARIVDLPPELLIAIMSSIATLPDTAVYSDKERQRDLASFALVNKQMSEPASWLLYAGKATLRNAGRIASFARTLEHRPDLCRKLKTLDCRIVHDACHPGHLNRVLKLPDVELASLAIHETYFFHGPASVQMRELLLTHHAGSMRSFTFVGSFRWFYEAQISSLLKQWTGLEHLALEFGTPQDRALESRPNKHNAPPTYKLKTFRITCHDWCFRAGYLAWYLGQSAGELDSLSLAVIDSWQIDIRPWSDRDLPLLEPYLVSCSKFDLKVDKCSFDIIEKLLQLAPDLRHFRLDYSTCPTAFDQGQINSLPKKLRTLELVGNLVAQRTGLLNIHLPTSLHEVIITGHFDSDPAAKQVQSLYERNGIRCIIRPKF
ncbi:hypothetical protein OIV83_004863 [Microbotryomycetes sp. JL201]|nr:hypothetical protein OIV83_004863 [Microbotryomycetes sp. JL201]